MKMNKLTAILLIAVLIAAVVFVVLYVQRGLTWYETDILGFALPLDCDVILFGTKTQPVFAIAAGFPGVDLIRLWPWPITQPWDDSRWEPVEGGLEL